MDVVEGHDEGQWWFLQPAAVAEAIVCTQSLQSCLTLCLPVDLEPTRLLRPLISPGKNAGVGPSPFPGDCPNSGIQPRSPALQADSSPSDPPGKPFINFPLLSFFSGRVAQ
ncbi:unnamed protein product [Rangifer tarandus platyrhynchus]|uniref:Uncharacterized protein n=2 Tax=Rangifer tarandus platyrhynchus TaxID=3082113 RepID=A0AC59YS94_RANTA|nr:unnamed protein product [Rangifer tarandus platyrhynchus]